MEINNENEETGAGEESYHIDYVEDRSSNNILVNRIVIYRHNYVV